MSFVFIIVTIIAGSFVGWTIGANDAANCVGAGIGSGKMTVKQGVFIVCFFSFLGAMLLGSCVVKTVGKGIVPMDKLTPEIALIVALSGCLGAGLCVLIATLRGLPVSTSHSIVGAVAGAGLAIGAPVVWEKLSDIFICWLLTPIGSGVIAYILYLPFRRIFYFLVPRKYNDAVVKFFIFFTSIYLAFIWGANDVANATGVITGAGIMSCNQASVLGAIAILIGVVTFGYRVIETIGFKITHLAPLMTIVAELASAMNVHLYTIFGIPVSTSHSIVGAVIGVGLIKGISMIDRKIVGEIMSAWLLTPLVSGVISFSIVKLITLLF